MFLVKGSISPGVYGIWQNAHQGQFLNSEAKLLAEMEILDEAPKDMPLPTKLPAPSRHYPLIPEGSYKKRNIFFGMQGPPAYFNKIVNIDFFMTTDQDLANDDAALSNQAMWEGTDPSAKLGLSYMEDRVDLNDMKVGTVEEWTIHDNSHLMHNTKPNGSLEGHPFHLHETSFEVIKIDGVAVDQIILQDTVWVPHGKSVTIRMHIKDNAVGKSVLHCHIIPHEESGMMMNTLVSR